MLSLVSVDIVKSVTLRGGGSEKSVLREVT